jgi:hypothetical protein
MSYFKIKYWSGEKYQELDDATCNLDYTYRRDVTHQSQYLEITTNVVQVHLETRRVFGEDQYLLQPTFVRRKQNRDEGSNQLDKQVEGLFFKLLLDDETSYDSTLPVLCATTDRSDIAFEPRSSFFARGGLMFMFQKKAKSYERIGAFWLHVFTLNTDGHLAYCNQSDWEFVPPGEEGSWDQLAERRTFLLG